MCVCKVCGYDGLEYSQYLKDDEPTFVICDCCGFESGYDDLDRGYSIQEYRRKWLKEGAKWFDKSKKPVNWSLGKQLKNISIKL